MGLTPIERIRLWWNAEVMQRDPARCEGCKGRGETFLSKGGYRYCSVECEAADAEEWADQPF